MNRIARILAPMALALALGACSGKADVDVDKDSANANVDLAPDTAATGYNADTTTTIGENNDTSAAVSLGGEGMEKLVEAKLIAAPGFGDVHVESGGEGVIILNGSVATAADKAEAERIAKEVDGVKTVTNNITVKQ